MPKVQFTQNIQRHVACPEMRVSGATVREALEQVFADNPQARGYVLDDQGRIRRHVNVWVNGNRATLASAVAADDEIYVFQALSGG